MPKREERAPAKVSEPQPAETKAAEPPAASKAVEPPAASKAAEPPPRTTGSFGRAGAEQSLAHFDTDVSRESCRRILEEDPYDWPAGIAAPQVLLDVGAYVGASTLALAKQFPEAKIHAYEPCAASAALLKANVAEQANVKVHEIAVWDRDSDRKLFDGKDDPVAASLIASAATASTGAEVPTRHGDLLLDDLGLVRLDGLKISTGGSEVAVLESVIRHMESTPVVFIAYSSETDRRRIDLILCATHILLAGRIEGPHRGQLCYGLRRVIKKDASGDRTATRLHRTPDK
ncbi:MAG: hypothetical protein Kilf2KO_02060 [Rhodospirillales bacterium]